MPVNLARSGAIAEFNGAHSFHHCGEGESTLHSRERRTNTEMNAVAEGDRAAILTRDIEFVRRIELLRIAVRRIHHAENPLTALEGFVADLRVFQHAPSQRAHWSVVAQDFLDRVLRQIVPLGEQL